MIRYDKLASAEVLMVLYNNATKYDGYEATKLPDSIQLGDKMDIKQAFHILDFFFSHYGNAYIRTLNDKILCIDLTNGKYFDETIYNSLNGLIMRRDGENFAKNCLLEYWEEERLKLKKFFDL